MRDTILTTEELEEDNLTEEDNDIIDKEMNEAIEETIKDIEEEIESNEDLQKEADELFSTDDIDERVEIYKKYHPGDDRFE